MATLHRLFYITKVCLRLLRKYANEIYPTVDPKAADLKTSASTKKGEIDPEEKSEEQLVPVEGLNPGTSKAKSVKFSMDAATPMNPKRSTVENLQLVECIGDVRALLIEILCDEIPFDPENDGQRFAIEILEECHSTFLSCFNAFYPTAILKWNCLCDLLYKKDRGILHARLLSAIVAGLCHPSVKLRSTFSLLSSTRESMSIMSPSDNSGLPMLSSTEGHPYPILVEQMTYRTQLDKYEFQGNTWTFNEVLVRLLDIISYPIKSNIENAYNRSFLNNSVLNVNYHQNLIDNCCHLLARVLSEIIYHGFSCDVSFSS